MTNGVMRIARLGPVAGGILSRPPKEVFASDFYASVDILSWTTSSTSWCYFALAGRGRLTPPTGGNGYIGGLVLNSGGTPGKIALSIWDGSADAVGPTFDIATTPPPYRLEFSVVGQNLRLRVLNPTTQAVIGEQTHVGTRFTEGFVCLWVNNPTYDPTTHEIIVDNFFATGTKP